MLWGTFELKGGEQVLPAGQAVYAAVPVDTAGKIGKSHREKAHTVRYWHQNS